MPNSTCMKCGKPIPDCNWICSTCEVILLHKLTIETKNSMSNIRNAEVKDDEQLQVCQEGYGNCYHNSGKS